MNCRMGAWIWVRYMVGGVGGMRESLWNGDYLGYGKFCNDWILTGFFMVQFLIQFNIYPFNVEEIQLFLLLCSKKEKN